MPDHERSEEGKRNKAILTQARTNAITELIKRHREEFDQILEVCAFGLGYNVMKKGKPVAAECGTNAGYYRHRRESELPCAKCVVAHAEDGRIRRARNKKEGAVDELPQD